MIHELINEITEDEGFISKPYKDTLGVLTIGFGTNIEQGITRPMARAMFETDLRDKIKELENKKPFVVMLSEERQKIIFNMVYQLGVGGVLKFKKMWLALENEDYKTASIEMLDSKWAKQTPSRAKRLASRMKRG